MPRPLALHQITAMEAGPLDLLDIAAETGCSHVCIFTHIPHFAAEAGFPCLAAADEAAMAARMHATGVGIENIEFFSLEAGTDLEAMRPGLALGAALGARRAVTHVIDDDAHRALDTLGRLADIAAGYGLDLGLEFMRLTPGCPSLAQAKWFVDQLGRANVAIAVDALHLVRSGGTPADVAALDARYFGYAQICDGHGLGIADDYMAEALDRALPGTGDFPLAALLDALPAALALDVEVPSPTRAAQGIGPHDRAHDAVTRARALIEQARPTR